MNRRQFYRNARAGLRPAAGGGLADGFDGVQVAVEIALGIGGGTGSFPQHVVGIAVTAFFRDAGAFQRLVDGGTHHKLGAHDLHGVAHRGANDRLAEAPHGFPQQAELARVVLVVVVDHLAGQQQAPGRGVDEQGFAVAQVRAPVAVRQLVPNEPIHRQPVRHPQQGFCQAHEDNPFLGRERELLQQGVDAALADLRLADVDHQGAGTLPGAAAGRLADVGDGQEVSQYLCLVPAVEDLHFLADGVVSLE